ncbi:MAG: hypothetical protein B6245_00480 [Desulfobacteraceae bacterium 4572_88]|nr:MAG: hypothetical protein B6245_00480 [Desulfobacteraceae bacterium 4572_88]
MHIEHIMPLSKSGTSDMPNLRIAGATVSKVPEPMLRIFWQKNMSLCLIRGRCHHFCQFFFESATFFC